MWKLLSFSGWPQLGFVFATFWHATKYRSCRLWRMKLWRLGPSHQKTSLYGSVPRFVSQSTKLIVVGWLGLGLVVRLVHRSLTAVPLVRCSHGVLGTAITQCSSLDKPSLETSYDTAIPSTRFSPFVLRSHQDEVVSGAQYLDAFRPSYPTSRGSFVSCLCA